MKKSLLLLLIALLAAPSLAGAAGRPGRPLAGKAAFKRSIERACERAGRERPGSPGGCTLQGLSRRVIAGNVAEYEILLKVGPGENDVIGLHRVVKENRPFRPIRTAKAVLMAHGDAWGFDAAFLASADSPAVPDARALPVFLARNGVDVWGIDFRWIQVPAEETDFGFMADWGLETDVHDLGVALAVARGVRLATGNGLRKIHLLGWSRGGITGYAYLNAETELRPGLRQAKGFIPVDIYYKSDVAEIRQAACNRAAAERAQLAGGTFASNTGVLFATLGTLAETDPAGASPVVPGLTNLQAALVAGAATFSLLPPDQVFAPFYHFAGGTFDAATGLPNGLTYTTVPYWLDFLQGASPYEPVRLLAESDGVICDEDEVPFDDHLDDITVPVLYVGAGGGVGDLGVYTTTLLGSTDVETRIVDLTPDRLSDFGHVDIFTATDARNLVWRPILEWIREH